MASLARVLLLLVLSAWAGGAPAVSPSPAEVGARAAGAWLDNADFMIYQVGDVTAVHYAEVASALGAVRLAETTGNPDLQERVADRHRRLLAADIPNTANHVDANVYGVWPCFSAARITANGACSWRTVSGAKPPPTVSPPRPDTGSTISG